MPRKRAASSKIRGRLHTGNIPSVGIKGYWGHGRYRRYGVVTTTSTARDLHDTVWVEFEVLTPKLEIARYCFELPDDVD